MDRYDENPVLLDAKDLDSWGGTFCPNPRAGHELWRTHPRVYLDVATTGRARCAYCSTVYQLREGQQIDQPVLSRNTGMPYNVKR